ncbi:proton-conducting transporter membrane subunit [Bradyrhizobium sp. 149]|uniref:proton-conducting transporter transmembrane domain-containing protein n=1 Tax=Bradyrhizobium sp. 149 TaxID=2782624 RepID=UPI001FFA1C4B|nr:proton-conducting transporter membrane subunit [Bradyrhizobium sp. 149]
MASNDPLVDALGTGMDAAISLRELSLRLTEQLPAADTKSRAAAEMQHSMCKAPFAKHRRMVRANLSPIEGSDVRGSSGKQDARAVAAATWTSLALLGPATSRRSPRAILQLGCLFLYHSVVAGTDVARRALDPRLPLRPGFITYPTRLPRGQRRNVFATLTSLLPGTVLAGEANAQLLYHCLDVEQAVVAELAREEAAWCERFTMTEFLTAAVRFILAMLALGLVSILRGPGDADRVTATQLIGTGGMAALLLLGTAICSAAACSSCWAARCGARDGQRSRAAGLGDHRCGRRFFRNGSGNCAPAPVVPGDRLRGAKKWWVAGGRPGSGRWLMPPSPALDAATTPSGFVLVLSIAIPISGALLAFVLGDRHVRLVACATSPLGLATAVATLLALPRSTGPLVYLLGAWPPPLGVALRADGLSAVMLGATAIVICAVAVFSYADFSVTAHETRAQFAFWTLLLTVWGALNTIFVAGDLFTLYVALELLTFAAVPLVSLDGRPETLRAAILYLLFALFGSVLYLLGTSLLYGLYGTLDIVLLSHQTGAEPAARVAAALMTTGLLAKTALFPLHLWLPPAHAGAPPAASAILSGLVVKGSFFIIVRLWFQVMPGLPGFAAAQLLAALGAAAIAFGSIVALRQQRLKLLIAYSTLAQIGYLFLMIPLALDASGKLESGEALAGGLLQAVSHATAKAAMFMAAGSIYVGLGHDRITGLRGVARALPLSVLAFAVAGIALIGVQPSGASWRKSCCTSLRRERGSGGGQSPSKRAECSRPPTWCWCWLTR